MGNYIERGIQKVASDDETIEKPRAAHELRPNHSFSEAPHPDDDDMADNINYHIYSYKQQMQHKEQQILKWAMAKLALTDELIRANVQRNFPGENAENESYDTDGYLTDDEMDEAADQELSHLETYRTKLIDIIVLLKRTNLRKKGKRSRRRKQIGKSNVLANKLAGLGLKRSTTM